MAKENTMMIDLTINNASRDRPHDLYVQTFKISPEGIEPTSLQAGDVIHSGQDAHVTIQSETEAPSLEMVLAARHPETGDEIGTMAVDITLSKDSDSSDENSAKITPDGSFPVKVTQNQTGTQYSGTLDIGSKADIASESNFIAGLLPDYFMKINYEKTKIPNLRGYCTEDLGFFV